MIESQFIFKPVGQGSFYTGKISKGYMGKKFKMVYDCGSLSSWEQLYDSIGEFKYIHSERFVDPQKFELNALFLSHLDDDHVNGLKKLLENCNCDCVYLPYLTPFERLHAALRHSVRNTRNYDEYLRFIASPHDYLLDIENSQIKRIVYIRGNSEKFNENEKPPESSALSDESPFTLSDNLADYQEINPEELEGPELSAKIQFKKANNALYLDKIWEFYIYFEPGTFDQLEDLKSELQLIGKWSNGGRLDLNQTDLRIILKDKGYLAELRKVYKRIFKSHNKTGLVLQHKPINYNKAKMVKSDCGSFVPHYFNNYNFYVDQFHRTTKILNQSDRNYWGITLLTGDIGMNQICNSDYIARNLKDIDVFQVPHHGSACGWDEGYISRLSTDEDTTAVINFGYGNRYGHPNPEVLYDLEMKRLDIRFCNQFEGFVYSIEIDK